MAAMLSGGQRLGLLSTTLNNASSAAGLHEFGNGNFEGLNEPTLGNSRKPGGNSNTKSVVLVKLTDSALKAITEYVKERNHQVRNPHRATSSLSPTINFDRQHGTISIPSLPKPGACLEENRDGGESTRSFSFNISDTVSDSGPQGSFEVLQSTKSGSVDTLGSIQKKLQIHADAGAYKRFGDQVLADQSERSKRSTQLLDRNTGRGLVTSGPMVRKTFSSKPVAGRNKPPSNDIHPSSFANSRCSDRAPDSDPPFRNFTSGSQLSASHPMLDRSSKGAYGPTNKSMTSEIMKRTLRERIVHLLAVRPYKKPELMVRIYRDGIKEKDKKSIMGILGSVSETKDNTYNLKRAFWNDVSEDWPFYTEGERQSFRRRKPQNLTPPGSDGGISVSSFGSGHSSSSSHPGSPQPTVSTSVNIARSPRFNDSRGNEHPRDSYRRVTNPAPGHQSALLKRASPASNSNGAIGSTSDRAQVSSNGHQQNIQNGIPPAKKKRVSNYKRPPDMQLNLSPHNNSGSLSDYGGRSPVFAASSSIQTGRSPRNVSGRGMQTSLVVPSRASPSSTLQYGVGLSSNDQITPSSEMKTSEWLLANGNNIGSNNRLPEQESYNKSPISTISNLNDNQHWNYLSSSPVGNENVSTSDQNGVSYTNNYSQMPTLSPTGANPNIAQNFEYVQQQCNVGSQSVIRNAFTNDKNSANRNTAFISDTDANTRSMELNNDDNASQLQCNSEISADGDQNVNHSSQLRLEKKDYSPLRSAPKKFVGTDFRKEYVKIRDRDTRKKYKLEFGRNYDRYRELHCKIEKVSKRFANLEMQLRGEPEGSESYKRMAEKVHKEYLGTKGRPEFRAMRQEFEYLHEKMAHIKSLVQEFDKAKMNTSK